jgi:hypothetical protein
MAYDIVFVDKPLVGRAVGDESIFLANLPTNPKIFAFFYRGSADVGEVEKRLRALGQKTGPNLFVHFSSEADPDYDKAEKRFGITKWPVVVVTAISPLAATPDGDNLFVRLDNRSLFADPEKLVRTVEELFNLFLREKIGQAIRTGWLRSGQAAISQAAGRVWSVIKPVITWVAERDISVGFLGVKIEVKEAGGHK